MLYFSFMYGIFKIASCISCFGDISRLGMWPFRSRLILFARAWAFDHILLAKALSLLRFRDSSFLKARV